MNGHKSDFRLYAAGKINKMDNNLLYDHLICHNIDYFHVSIVDMTQVGNNTEFKLDELLSRIERKWIWDLCFITPYGQNQDDGYYCQNKRCRIRKVRYRTLRLFIPPFLLLLLFLPAPSYVTDMLHKKPLHTRNTRSSSYTMPLLNKPAHSKATLSDRSFSFASS